MSNDEMRELDAWLAVHVMGWKPIDRVAVGWGQGPRVWSTGEDPEDEKSSPTYQGFFPSSQAREAMMVLEKCIGKTRRSVCFGKSILPDKCVVYLSGAYERTKQEAETLPLAICLFAKAIFTP